MTHRHPGPREWPILPMGGLIDRLLITKCEKTSITLKAIIDFSWRRLLRATLTLLQKDWYGYRRLTTSV